MASVKVAAAGPPVAGGRRGEDAGVGGQARPTAAPPQAAGAAGSPPRALGGFPALSAAGGPHRFAVKLMALLAPAMVVMRTRTMVSRLRSCPGGRPGVHVRGPDGYEELEDETIDVSACRQIVVQSHGRCSQTVQGLEKAPCTARLNS